MRFPNASSTIKVVHFNWGWEQFEDYSINLANYEAEIGNLYAKLQTAFPLQLFLCGPRRRPSRATPVLLR